MTEEESRGLALHAPEHLEDLDGALRIEAGTDLVSKADLVRVGLLPARVLQQEPILRDGRGDLRHHARALAERRFLQDLQAEHGRVPRGDVAFSHVRRLVTEHGRELGAVRRARLTDIEKWLNAVDQEDRVQIKARKIARNLRLDMKINDVEFQGDGRSNCGRSPSSPPPPGTPKGRRSSTAAIPG